MSGRASLALGPRRGGTSFLSSSLSSSQAAGPSSQPPFSFRPHFLLPSSNQTIGGRENNGPFLDYSDLTDRIEVFKELFTAQTENILLGLKHASEEQGGVVREEKRNAELIKEAIDRQRAEHEKLRQAIASEQKVDSSAQAQLSHLQLNRAALTKRLSEAEDERDRLLLLLDQRAREKEGRKAKIQGEVRRNRPELRRFNEKLGCRVSAGGPDGGKGTPPIKFTFNLVNPDDWAYEAKFVIDTNKPDYQIVSHSPTLPQDKLNAMLADLNSSRALFTFIKQMRAAFKEVIQQQRLAQKAARSAHC